MDGIFAQLVTPQLGALSAGIIAVMLIIGSAPFKGAKLRDHALWKDWGLFLNAAIAVAASFAPGVCDVPPGQWGGVIIFGLLGTVGSLVGRKILQPIFLNKLEGKKK